MIENISLDGRKDFYSLSIDKRLSLLNKAVENLLKEGNKYKDVNIQFFCGIIDDNIIKTFRKKTHCFRHGLEESIRERKNYSHEQKQFLVNFGITVVDGLLCAKHLEEK